LIISVYTFYCILQIMWTAYKQRVYSETAVINQRKKTTCQQLQEL